MTRAGFLHGLATSSAVAICVTSIGCAAGGDENAPMGTDTGVVDAHPQDTGADTSKPDTAPDSTVDASGDGANDSAIDAADSVSPIDSTVDAPIDSTSPDTSTADAPADTHVADTTPDAAPDVLDAADAADAPLGPATPGTYVFEAIPQYVLTNPPSAAWHPSGSYALVLNETDAVYSYDPATKALTKVGAAGTTVSWRAIAFTPDGAKAVLLGNTTAPQGQIWIWDHATSTLTQLTTAAYAGGTYESIAFRPNGAAKLLGSRAATGGTYIATLWDFSVAAGPTAPSAKNTSAGCQDLAWATDSFGAPAVAVVCGVNGVTLLHVDGGGVWNVYTGNAGNTSRISARPQGDYALAVGWSGAKLYRYQTGGWNTDYGNPSFTGIYQVAFSTDGRRALILGGVFSGLGQIHEFRDDYFVAAEITDVSIPGFTLAPYNASTNTKLNDAAWRPNCEGGLVVAGEDSFSAKKGMLIKFSVSGGVSCPN